MERKSIKTVFDLALFFLEIHKRETGNFKRDLNSYSDRDLIRILGVSCDRTLEYMIKNGVIHPRHNAEIKRALPYLSALKEMQAEAWQRISDHRKKEKNG